MNYFTTDDEEEGEANYLPRCITGCEPDGETHMKERAINFEDAKARFVHRFTMEHIPNWSQWSFRQQGGTSDCYPAPQFRTDREWYENTEFPGEGIQSKRSKFCSTSNQTWPLGHTLDKPYTR